MILRRDEFINEIYLPVKEQKEYENLVILNEGMIKRLFGKIRNLFKNDWDSIKGDRNLVKIYKELDDKLSGFSTMKLEKRDQCNKIRQELVNFASIWYEQKMNNAKKNDRNPKPAVSMEFKDETLKDSLEKCQRVIKEVSEGDSQMNRWAQILMDDMKIVINQSILNDIEDEEVRKETEKQNQELEKKQDEINKKMEKFQNEQLTKIGKERKDFITNVEATPVKDDLLGDKTIQNLCGEFKKIDDALNKKGADRRKIYDSDNYLGLKSIITDDVLNDKTNYRTTYKMLTLLYTSLGKNEVMDKFKEVPGLSVQAMCIGINSFIKNCIYGGNDYGNELPLMAKCAVVSNGVISYNLPLNDKGDGNYFTEIVGSISNGDFSKTDNTINLPDDFKRNAKNLLNKIIMETKKLKEQGEKDYENKMKLFDTQFEKKKNK